MTGPEMIYQWKVEFDVIASGAAPGFEDSEIYVLLNKAYNNLILELYKNKDWVSLQNLIHATFCVNGALPIMFWLYVDSYSNITRSSYPSTGFSQTLNSSIPLDVTNKLVSVEDFSKYRQSIFNFYSIIKNPYVCISGNLISIITDIQTTLFGITVIYIKIPLTISNNQQCDLQESFHKTIVTIAVELAKQSISIKEPKKQ